ncbi:ABC transporter substrate-binding protein [Cohnella hongkongensis]|uniref:ABC transporter substrate-binding protein n=1 Tax=Cohnella hongkongensis TaxID=178337 RepID=A0ABV9F6S8_9BACL
MIKWSNATKTTVLLASAAMLAACGSQTPESASPSSGGSAGKAVEIEFWHGLGGKLGETMQSMIDEFNQSQDEVIVKPVIQGNYDETKQKLQAAIAANNPPAVALVEDREWAAKGYFKAMDEYIASLPDFQPDDFVQSFLIPGQVDGKQYSLPVYGTTQVLYYRKDMLEQAGISPDRLKTWEGLAEVARQLTVRENGETKVYGWEPMWDAGNLIDAVYSRGGTILNEDGTRVMIDSPEWIDTWEAFRGWIHDEKIMRIHYGGQGWEYWYKTIDDVMQGRAAGYTGSAGDIGDLDLSIIGAAPQPAWEGHVARPSGTATYASIPAAAPPEQQEAAFKWLAFVTSSENTAKWSMASGYIPVRSSAAEDPAFVEFTEQNPQYKAPLEQVKTATPYFNDPTHGKIFDALNLAADKLEIENRPAAEVLVEAQKTAQKELDKVLNP